MGRWVQSCCPPDKSYFVIASTGLAKGSRSKQQARCFHTGAYGQKPRNGERECQLPLLCNVGNIFLAGRFKTLYNSTTVLKAVHSGKQ